MVKRSCVSLRVEARPALLATACLWLGFACSGGQSGAEDPVGPDGPGLPGQAECFEDLDCREQVTRALEGLAPPAPRTVELSGSRCEPQSIILEFESVGGNACLCDKAEGGQLMIGPVGLGCYITGRNGQCIIGDGDYQSCDTSAPDSCAAICADAAARIEADTSRPVATELLLAECRESHCRSVVSLDGHCYANNDYSSGRESDCSLGTEGILQAADAANAPPELTPEPEDEVPYRPGTSATLNLVRSLDWYGRELTYEGFGAMAQFFQTIEGTSSQALDVIDPLEGIDDCGVSRLGSSGALPSLELLDVDTALLRDGDTERPLEEFDGGFGFYSYGVDLGAAGVTPRHGGTYGFAASGGGFGASIQLGGIVLPEALAIPELERQSRVEPGPLDLTWTGRGSAPLRVSMYIATTPTEFTSYTIDCRLTDDGAFSIPREVLEAVPEGLVVASFTRENRRVQRSGDKSVQTIAAVNVSHRFVLGPACDGTASMAACQSSASAMGAAYEACGLEPPPLATLCPDYISESCNTCPEYFECLAQTTSCDASGFTSASSGCGCPSR